MKFRHMKSKLNAFAMATVFALVLAGCGGGGGTAEEPPPPMPTPQEQCEAAGNVYVGGQCITPAEHAQNTCEAAGGQYEADGSCTSADDRVAQAQCLAAGGRVNDDGSCTDAAGLAAEMCEAGGGRYNTDGTCSSPQDIANEMCVAAGGRVEADNSCTPASTLVAEARCEGAGGQFNADGTCTSAAELACVGGNGRWNADGTCTDSAGLAQEMCEADGGRYNADGTCTDSAGLAQEMCEAGGGRYNADGTCSSAQELANEMCVAAGGRVEADNSCTTAAEIAQEMCEAGGGRYNADGTCTSAEDRIAEAARMACENAGGRYEADGSCTPAATVAQETCEAGGGRYETDGSCTSAADVALEMCVAGGGRDNGDGTCTEKSVLDATASAETKEKAIDAEGEQTTDAGLGGSDNLGTDGATGTEDDPYSLSISRPSSGTEIKITDSGQAGMDDPKFEQAMDLGGGTTMHVRTQEADDDDNVVEEVVIVSTDIAAPKATKFSTVYTLDVNTDTTNDAPAVTNEALDIDETDADVRGRVKSGAFVPGAGSQTVLTFDYAQTDGDPGTDGNQPVKAFETMGTYDGGMGTYKCNSTSADCTVTLDEDGDITAMSDGWIFTPADGSTVNVPDSDFLHYGFWLKKTTDADGAVEYNEVETFAGSSIDASTGSELDSVRGSATYEGGAVGVYVHSVTNSDGTRASATSGHFSADVSLTAIFGQVHEGDNPSDTSAQGTIAASMLNTVTGTIHSFELSGGEANAWSATVDAERAASGNTFSGTAKGGAPNDNGSISGTFFGLTPETEVTTDGDRREAPGSMAGEFNAGFSNGSVTGAFGARKK